MPKIIDFPALNIADGIEIDPECEDEIYAVLEKSEVMKFAAAYRERIRLLSTYREKAISVHPKWFEQLKHVGAELFSMHIANVGNMRILYYVGRRTIVLLCAFLESEGKGKRRKSYVQYIPVALERMKRYEEE